MVFPHPLVAPLAYDASAAVVAGIATAAAEGIPGIVGGRLQLPTATRVAAAVAEL